MKIDSFLRIGLVAKIGSGNGIITSPSIYIVLLLFSIY